LHAVNVFIINFIVLRIPLCFHALKQVFYNLI